MREITGELWDYYGRPEFVVCITTNGTVKNNGEGIMGRGCAEEAKRRFPGIAKALGEAVRQAGNVVVNLAGWLPEVGGYSLLTFPVKHNWWEKADVELIAQSARKLRKLALETDVTLVLPRPGCGNGGLDWRQVRSVIEFLPDNVWVISR